jgi:hypothetical protein
MRLGSVTVLQLVAVVGGTVGVTTEAQRTQRSTEIETGWFRKNPVLNSVRLRVLCASVVRLDPNRLVAERYTKRRVVTRFVRRGWPKTMLNSLFY